MKRNAQDARREKELRGDGKAEDENRVANPPSHDDHQRFSHHKEGRDVDAMSEDSFPASDPPSTSGATPGAPDDRPSVDELLKRQNAGQQVSKTHPRKPDQAGDKSVEELAKRAWAGVDADSDTG